MKLLIFPLKKELEYFLDKAKQNQIKIVESWTASKKKIWRLPEKSLLLCVGGIGTLEIALHLQRVIYECQEVKEVILVGSAGSLCGYVKVGDLVIATECKEVGWQGNQMVSMKDWPTHEKLKNWIQEQLEYDKESTHWGAILSVSTDVMDAELSSQLYDFTKALAVAWEGTGGARVCAFHGKPYLEVRGITDRANSETPVQFTQELERVMHKLAQFFCSL